MEVLETLAVALGFATLAGLNLYLTVFITGLAINQGWVNVAGTYPELMVLGDPAILIASGLFFGLQFFSDKIPWVDSLWDTVHTLVRPIGGGLLAMSAVGSVDPAFEVIVGMLAGGATLVTHGFKSGTRLAINSSPEPFTNVAASVAEDVVVIGGLALMSKHPYLTAGICLVFIALCLYLAPKLFRRVKVFTWLVGNKFTSFFAEKNEDTLLYGNLTMDEDLALMNALKGDKPEVNWSVKALVGPCRKFRNFTPNTFGRLVSASNTEGVLHFIGRRMWKEYHTTLALDELEVTQESRFFSEDVVIYSRGGKRKLTLRLPSGQKALSNRLVEEILGTGNGKVARMAESLAENKSELAGKEV